MNSPDLLQLPCSDWPQPSLVASQSPRVTFKAELPIPSILYLRFPKIGSLFQMTYDCLRIFVRLGLAAQIARQSLALSQGGENGILNLDGIFVEAHVP